MGACGAPSLGGTRKSQRAWAQVWVCLAAGPRTLSGPRINGLYLTVRMAMIAVLGRVAYDVNSGTARIMNSSNSGTVKATSPCAGL